MERKNDSDPNRSRPLIPWHVLADKIFARNYMQHTWTESKERIAWIALLNRAPKTEEDIRIYLDHGL